MRSSTHSRIDAPTLRGEVPRGRAGPEAMRVSPHRDRFATLRVLGVTACQDSRHHLRRRREVLAAVERTVAPPSPSNRGHADVMSRCRRRHVSGCTGVASLHGCEQSLVWSKSRTRRLVRRSHMRKINLESVIPLQFLLIVKKK
jgi:hypothetical protein